MIVERAPALRLDLNHGVPAPAHSAAGPAGPAAPAAAAGAPAAAAHAAAAAARPPRPGRRQVEPVPHMEAARLRQRSVVTRKRTFSAPLPPFVP